MPTSVLWSTKTRRETGTHDNQAQQHGKKSQKRLRWRDGEREARDLAAMETGAELCAGGGGDEEDTSKKIMTEGGACIAWHACKACTHARQCIRGKRRRILFGRAKKIITSKIFAYQSSPRIRFLVSFSLQIAERFFMIPAFPV